MPTEGQDLLRAAPGTPPPAVVTEVVDVLAGVLRLKADRIDPAQSFRSLGMGSVLTVTFVSRVNARCGSSVKVTALFDHPTPLAFAAHVAAEAEARRTPAEPAPREVTAGPVLDLLREQLAGVLRCDARDIDSGASFTLLGVDSVLGARFVAAVNRTFGMKERPVTLYSHPNLDALAAHVAGLPEAPPAPVAAEAPDVRELGALLDAVGADQLSVEEALARLPRRL